MSSRELFISRYLRRRQWLRQIVGMCHIACWLRSSAVLKFDQFYHSSFSKPSLDLFPRKCAYAEVIDLHSMILWSIGLIANRYRIPSHQISLCPLLVCIWHKLCRTAHCFDYRFHCAG